MPPKQNTSRPDAAVAVAEQYLRYERPLSILVVVLLVSVFLGTFRAMSLLPALIVAAVLLIIVRFPTIRPQGTARLRSDDDIETVVESFTDATPPVLVFQWGIADEILLEDSTVTYRVSYLFGLRSVGITVQTQTTTTHDGEYQVDLEVMANGQPWSTYSMTIQDRDGETVIEYEYMATRRFGLRRVPQRLIAKRYRNKALREQGYTVVDRNEQYSV